MLTAIPGIRVGHGTDDVGCTGCTVILCPEGTVGGVDIRGSAAGTREMDALYPMHLVPSVHAVLFAGGSAFGLDAAGGVMRYLEERGVGFDVQVTRVPIVPAAILFDLRLGDAAARPDARMAYAACRQATSGPFPEGCVGAGTGATVGKLFGVSQAMKSGLGSAALEVSGGVKVAALVAVNAFGDVRDPATGTLLAGARTAPESFRLANTAASMRDGVRPVGYKAENTTLAVVATNARLTKAPGNQAGPDGAARPNTRDMSRPHHVGRRSGHRPGNRRRGGGAQYPGPRRRRRGGRGDRASRQGGDIPRGASCLAGPGSGLRLLTTFAQVDSRH